MSNNGPSSSSEDSKHDGDLSASHVAFPAATMSPTVKPKSKKRKAKRTDSRKPSSAPSPSLPQDQPIRDAVLPLHPRKRLKSTPPSKPPKPSLGHTMVSPCGLFHPPQYNIGVEILKQFVSSGAYNPAWTHCRFNLLFIGPAATDLQEQTEGRLWKLFESNDFPDHNCFRHKTVTNSSSLPSLQHEFFDVASAHPDAINLVVHDEGHWGIAKASNIHQFFCELVQRNLNNLMVLLVSATPYVIQDIMENTVDWQALRMSDNPYFAAPSYRSVFDLCVIQDEGLAGKREGESSQIVLNEYAQEQGFAKEILDEIKGHKGPIMTVVRFSHQKRAELCAEHMRKRLGDCFVLALTSQTTIRRALNCEVNERGLKLPPKLFNLMNNKKKDIIVENLSELRVVLVVVGKISMGETLPHTLAYFDIRGKYAHCTPASTIIQDLGRCAGYDKPDVTCLVSFNDDLQKIFEKRRLDGLMTKTHRYTKAHPNCEPENGGDGDDVLVYEELAEKTVLLSAEPQIGKTGAVLALLFIINELQRGAMKF